MLSRNITTMPIVAIVPNSISILFPVMRNVANPAAVVRLVRNVAFPTFIITRYNAFILLPWALYST